VYCILPLFCSYPSSTKYSIYLSTLHRMKKKKAAMLARKLEAEKQLAAKKSSTTDSDDKSSKEEDSSAVEVDVDKSEEKQATLSPKPPLASVPESTEAKDVPTTDAPKMTFGSSSTVLPPSTFGSMPKPPTMQSEPDCPKPTFGSSGFGSGVAPPTFGSASTTTFGGAATSKPSTTGFGVATTSAKPADESSPKGSGAFLNLTPPKTGNTPGKFVFGSGAPITLAAPSTTSMDAAQTLASFGQPAKFGTGFGTSSGGFGSVAKPSAFGSSPFGGGAGDASKKRPLDSTTDEKGEGDDSQPDAKKVHTEEEEKEADADESKAEAAKEA